MANPQDLYNPVPTVSPQTGMPFDYGTTRVTPDSMGAGVAEATERLGGQIGKLSDVIVDIGLKRQGMINETLSTDAETQAAAKYAQILGQYKSTQGLQSVNLLPKTIQELQKVRTDILETLPNEATKRSFNMLATRREAFALEDVNEYSASQIKNADRTSANASRSVSVDRASSFAVANSDIQFNSELANVRFQTSRILENQGYGPDGGTGMKQDPITGELTFDLNTEAGKQAKAVFDNELNTAEGAAWENRIRTLAFDPKNGNVLKAVEVLDQNKDRIPSATYAKLSASLSAPYRSNQTRAISDNVFANFQTDYNNSIQPSADDTGTPFSSVNAQTTLKNLFPGVTITSTSRTPEHNKEVGGVPNSYHLQDGAVDFVIPEGKTFEEVRDTLQRNGVPVKELINEKDHIHWAFGGTKGSYQNMANYARTHYADYINQARELARQQFPDDPNLADQAATRTEQRLNDIIRTQELSNKANQDLLINTVYNNKQPITNSAQLEVHPDPKVRQAWRDYELNNPQAAQALSNKLITANSRGASNGFGTDFYGKFRQVLSGQVHDSADFLNSVGGTKDDVLTGRGFQILNEQLNSQGSPEGAAFAKAELTFLDSLHNNATGKQFYPGIQSPVLEAKFRENLAKILPAIEAGKKDGKSASQLFNPDSPDYVGKLFVQPTQNEISNEAARSMLLNMGQTFNNNDPSVYTSLADLQKAVKEGKVTRDAAIKYSLEKKWIKEDAPSVPRPTE